MSVFKRKTTRGESKFYHYKFMSHGKYFTGVCPGCQTKKAALDYERALRTKTQDLSKQKTAKALVENFRDDLTGGEKINLVDAFDLSLKKPRKRQPTSKSIERKRTQWNDFVAFMVAEYPNLKHLADVRKKHAEDYIQRLRSDGKYNKSVTFKVQGQPETRSYTSKHKGLSKKTCNDFHLAISEVFKLLYDDAGLIENPFAKIPKLNNEPETREAFSEEELKKIAKEADDFVYPIFAIGICTALREGDICTLRWEEIDFESNVITRKMSKTGRAVEIPILPPLRGYLLELKEKANGKEYVLPDHAEMYQNNRTGIAWRVKKFLESLKIQTTRKVPGRSRAVSVKDVHSLRHSFCYYAGVYGIPFMIVKDIVGHVNEKMTELYQKHADNKLKREKLMSLPDFMGLAGEQETKQLVEGEKSAKDELRKRIDELTEDEAEEWLRKLNG